MSISDPSTDDGTGGPFPHTVSGQLSDVRSSVHDPGADLLLPAKLSLDDWLNGVSREVLLVKVVEQALELVSHGRAANSELVAAARQKGPRDVAELERALGAAREVRPGHPPARTGSGDSTEVHAPRTLDRFREVADSVKLFEKIRKDWLDAPVDDEINLGAAGFKIRDQGRNASCVGHAVADLVERQRRAYFDPPSARFLWQAAKEMDADARPTTMIAGAGTSLRAGLDVVRRFGYATESELPTSNNELFQGSLVDFYETIGRRRASRIVNLGAGSKAWLAWLHQGRPIVAALRVGDNFLRTGNDMIIKPDPVDEDSFSHAVLLMGYRFVDGRGGTVRTLLENLREESRTTDEDVPVEYLVRNSAGRGWGDQGYAWMPQTALCAQAHEGYGLLWEKDEEILLPR